MEESRLPIEMLEEMNLPPEVMYSLCRATRTSIQNTLDAELKYLMLWVKINVFVENQHIDSLYDMFSIDPDLKVGPALRDAMNRTMEVNLTREDYDYLYEIGIFLYHHDDFYQRDDLVSLAALEEPLEKILPWRNVKVKLLSKRLPVPWTTTVCLKENSTYRDFFDLSMALGRLRLDGYDLSSVPFELVQLGPTLKLQVYLDSHLT